MRRPEKSVRRIIIRIKNKSVLPPIRLSSESMRKTNFFRAKAKKMTAKTVKLRLTRLFNSFTLSYGNHIANCKTVFFPRNRTAGYASWSPPEKIKDSCRSPRRADSLRQYHRAYGLHLEAYLLALFPSCFTNFVGIGVLLPLPLVLSDKNAGCASVPSEPDGYCLKGVFFVGRAAEKNGFVIKTCTINYTEIILIKIIP